MSEQPNATHKLICCYNDPAGQPGAQGPASEVEWELFDLIADPFEVDNLFGIEAHRVAAVGLYERLLELQEAVGDTPFAIATPKFL